LRTSPCPGTPRASTTSGSTPHSDASGDNGQGKTNLLEAIFVSNNTGRGVAVVDTKSARSLPGIDIGGGAGNTQWDADSGHIFAAVHGSPK
jgi:hypothetical protein